MKSTQLIISNEKQVVNLPTTSSLYPNGTTAANTGKPIVWHPTEGKMSIGEFATGVVKAVTITVAQAQDYQNNPNVGAFVPGDFYFLADGNNDGSILIQAVGLQSLAEQDAYQIIRTPKQGGGFTESYTAISYDLATDTISPRQSGSTGSGNVVIEQNLNSNSTTAVPSIKAVADAINAHSIDESNLVHKTGDEVVYGVKHFPNGIGLGNMSVQNVKNAGYALGVGGNFAVVATDGHDGDGAFRLRATQDYAGIQATKVNITDNHILALNADGGNVGVGTKTPTEKLEVNGNIKANFIIADGSKLTNLPITKYTAGANISIANNVITAVGINNKVDKYVIDGIAYNSVADAIPNLYTNATLTLRGNINDFLQYPVIDNSTIDCNSAVLSTSNFLIGDALSTNAYNLNIIGGSHVSSIGISSTKSTTKNKVTITDAVLGSSGYYIFSTEGVPANNIIDEIEFVRLKGVKTTSAGQVPIFRFVGNTYTGDRPLKITFTDCDIESTIGNVFGGFTPRGTKIYLRGTTKIKGLTGINLVNGLRSADANVNTGGSGSTVQYTQAEIIVDERPVANSGMSIAQFPEFTATSTGTQNIVLGAGAIGVLTVQVSEAITGATRTIYLGNCTVANNVLTISANSKINIGDKIIGNYYK